jgi:putative solute:sodium symporter small subunit
MWRHIANPTKGWTRISFEVISLVRLWAFPSLTTFPCPNPRKTRIMTEPAQPGELPAHEPNDKTAREHEYWHHNLKIMARLLVVWFLVSFGCGILWVDFLNELTFRTLGNLCVIAGCIAMVASLFRWFSSSTVEDSSHGYTAIPLLWAIAFILLGIFFGARGTEVVRLGGFKLGFWFAQQGAIYVFVLLIFIYVKLMNKLDHEFGVEEE